MKEFTLYSSVKGAEVLVRGNNLIWMQHIHCTTTNDIINEEAVVFQFNEGPCGLQIDNKTGLLIDDVLL